MGPGPANRARTMQSLRNSGNEWPGSHNLFLPCKTPESSRGRRTYGPSEGSGPGKVLPLKVSLSSQFEVLRTLSDQQEQVLYWSGPAHLPATRSITMVDVAVGPAGKQPKAYPGLQCLLLSLGWEITAGCRGRGGSKAEPSLGQRPFKQNTITYWKSGTLVQGQQPQMLGTIKLTNIPEGQKLKRGPKR